MRGVPGGWVVRVYESRKYADLALDYRGLMGSQNPCDPVHRGRV